jgi:hypothetical protein
VQLVQLVDPGPDWQRPPRHPALTEQGGDKQAGRFGDEPCRTMPHIIASAHGSLDPAATYRRAANPKRPIIMPGGSIFAL